MSRTASAGGALSFFEFVGVPRSWLSKRPRLPSRNWLIFLSVTSSLSGAYIYDRRQCKKIKQAYLDKVIHLSQVPLQTWELPRKVTVYTSKWPGDDDYERGIIYFKKYVKPHLVAAAIDYQIISGKQHGALCERVASDIVTRRRRKAGLEPPPAGDAYLNSKLHTPEMQEQRLLEGGSIVIGRSTFKEYMQGLHDGWSVGLQPVNKEDELVQELSEDGVFDEPESEDLGETIPEVAVSKPFVFSPLQTPGLKMVESNRHPATPAPSIPDVFRHPPDAIPQQPPILLVPFKNRIGFTQIPMMIVDFFNRRKDVKDGAEAASTVIDAVSREINRSDLEWDRMAEGYYKSSVSKIPSETEKSRAKYYKELPKKIATARQLARGEREPTKDEVNFPPQTEVELRAERLKKEARWRELLRGWELVKPEASVMWDDRFESSLRLFTPSADQYSL